MQNQDVVSEHYNSHVCLYACMCAWMHACTCLCMHACRWVPKPVINMVLNQYLCISTVLVLVSGRGIEPVFMYFSCTCSGFLLIVFPSILKQSSQRFCLWRASQIWLCLNCVNIVVTIFCWFGKNLVNLSKSKFQYVRHLLDHCLCGAASVQTSKFMVRPRL